MRLVRQVRGSNLCGQACIATVCGITLEEAITLVQTRGKTSTGDLKRALDARGVQHGERRINGFPKKGSALLYWRSAREAHWVVWHNKKYYDPAAGVFRQPPKHLSKARVTSHLPITV